MVGGEHDHSSDFLSPFKDELKGVDGEKKEEENTLPPGFGTTRKDKPRKEEGGWGA